MNSNIAFTKSISKIANKNFICFEIFEGLFYLKFMNRFHYSYYKMFHVIRYVNITFIQV